MVCCVTAVVWRESAMQQKDVIECLARYEWNWHRSESLLFLCKNNISLGRRIWYSPASVKQLSGHYLWADVRVCTWCILKKWFSNMLARMLNWRGLNGKTSLATHRLREVGKYICVDISDDLSDDMFVDAWPIMTFQNVFVIPMLQFRETPWLVMALNPIEATMQMAVVREGRWKKRLLLKNI